MPRTISSLVGILLVLTVALTRADEPARAIIDQAIEAAGGAENLRKFDRATWTEQGTFHGMGQVTPYAGKYANEWPDKFRMEIEGAFIVVLSGKQGWMKNFAQSRPLTDLEVQEQGQNHYAGYVASLLPLADPAFHLSRLPDIQVKERPAVGVKVTREGRPDVELYFDKLTGLLAKSQYRGRTTDLGGEEVLFETIFQDYQSIDGIKSPAKLSMRRAGQVFVEARVTDYRAAEKLDPKLFKSLD